MAADRTDKSAAEVTLVSARERREPRGELASSVDGSKENLEPEREAVEGVLWNFSLFPKKRKFR